MTAGLGHSGCRRFSVATLIVSRSLTTSNASILSFMFRFSVAGILILLLSVLNLVNLSQTWLTTVNLSVKLKLTWIVKCTIGSFNTLSAGRDMAQNTTTGSRLITL